MFQWLKKLRPIQVKCVIHPEKTALNHCHVCQKKLCVGCLILGPEYYYCKSQTCHSKLLERLDYVKNPRFCPTCLKATVDESSGDITSFNMIGDHWVDERHIQCDVCGSVIMEKISTSKWHKTSYRVIFLDENETKFISRKVKDEYL